jgi:hypothetical protein
MSKKFKHYPIHDPTLGIADGAPWIPSPRPVVEICDKPRPWKSRPRTADGCHELAPPPAKP